MSGLSNRRIPSPGAPSSPLIEPANSLIYARLRASLDELDKGDFTEGHELPGKWKVAKEMMGRRLSQEEAKMLLAFEGDEESAQVIQLLHRELHRFTSAPIDAMTRPVEDISVSLHDDAR